MSEANDPDERKMMEKKSDTPTEAGEILATLKGYTIDESRPEDFQRDCAQLGHMLRIAREDMLRTVHDVAARYLNPKAMGRLAKLLNREMRGLK